MNCAFEPVITRPDPALLAAVSERLAQVLASNTRLAQSPTINFHARRCVEAVIAGLIDALDRLGRESRFKTSRIRGGRRQFRRASRRSCMTPNKTENITNRAQQLRNSSDPFACSHHGPLSCPRKGPDQCLRMIGGDTST